ncbi:MAG TPA: tetratricopeptide repeat protein, partial [Bacteroidia bacterium]|nr:tetratricopeptide repeat protein [Bacteroidia bacterium]
LIRERQWKSLVWMVLPFVLWNIAAGILTGDFNYVFNQTFGADKGVNRYGQTSFLHYFERYFYVTGPVVALLLLVGMVSRIRSKNVHPWIDGQYFLGFLVYVVFSWKLSMGNAAGFLRNLVPLAPLAALIALDGYNQALAVLSGKAYADRPKDLQNDRLLLSLAVLASLGITAICFSRRLVLHQIIDSAPDYSLLLVMALAVLTGLLLQGFKWPSKESTRGLALALGLALLATAYTVVTEPADASANVERQAVGTIANFYKDSEFQGKPTYVNHSWFFWAADINAADPKFGRVTQANLDQAPTGAVVVWDAHYATRLSGDVLPPYFSAHPEFVELLRVGHPDLKECVILYEKVGADSARRAQRSATFSAAHPKFLPAIAGRAHFLMQQRDYRAAVERFDYMLGSVQNDPGLWHGRGMCMMEAGFYSEAVANLQNALTLQNRFPIGWYQLGIAQVRTGDLKSALVSLNRSLALGNQTDVLYHARGAVLADMGDFQGAAADYSLAISLNPENLQHYSDRAAVYALANRIPEARADIARVLAKRPTDPQAIFVQGRIELQAGNKDEGCRLMQQAVDLGLPGAAGFIAKNCGVGQDLLSNPP